MRIGIVFDRKKPDAVKSVLAAEAWLKERKHKVYRIFGDKILKQLDFVITFGGDGLVLHTANKIKKYNIPILRVNFGYAGALTNIKPDVMLEKLSEVFEHDNYIIVERTRMEVAVLDELCDVILLKDALNDVVIERRDSRTIVISVEIDGIKYEYRGDGVIFATKTGATAYVESAGGPTLISDEKFILRVVSPSSRELLPYIIRPSSAVFQVREIIGKARLTVDGSKILNLNKGQLIVMQKARMTTLFVEIGDVKRKNR
ncbi:MAG: NAD(+)/NADH kinase [Candidatus Paceibacterota bacterium]|jgi:NAD+ kinase